MAKFHRLFLINGNSSWYGALGFRFAISCLVREALSGEALEGDIRALFIIDAQFGAGVLAEIELGQIPVKVLAIDMLVDADKAAFQDRKEAFERVGMHVIPHPFELGMIYCIMARNGRKLVARSQSMRYKPSKPEETPSVAPLFFP